LLGESSLTDTEELHHRKTRIAMKKAGKHMVKTSLYEITEEGGGY
jgi:hypothetical protein